MNAATSRFPLLVAAVAVTVCLGFAGLTGHAWEDYYITFRASLNLASGHGLVYQPGERIHSFTSPLGTLLPALFAVGGGDDVAERALWCFRWLSAALLAGAIGLAAQRYLRAGLTLFATGAASLAWALDAKTIDYSINGMESALLVFFIVLAWRALQGGMPSWRLAVALAGLQWTRPDGGVFFAVLALAWLAFAGHEPNTPSAKRRIRWLLTAGGWGLLMYLPWLLWAWYYYGSPVPHTIMAKVSHHAPGELVRALMLYPWRLFFGHAALHDVFKPAYFYFGGWPVAVLWYARFLAVGAAIAWLVPGVRSAGRIASAAFFLGGFYVEYIPRSPWYYPGWEVLGFIAWAFLLDAALIAAKRGPPWTAAALRVTGALLVVIQASLLACTGVQMRWQQTIIENDHRRELGRWLRLQAAPGDRVYLEPLGYIGYFSGLKMLDYPGLASPEVVAARRAGHLPHAGLIAALAPEWLVLRRDQVEHIRAERPDLMGRDYQLVRVFDVRARIDALKFLPGRGYLDFDALYFVFRRNPSRSMRP